MEIVYDPETKIFSREVEPNFVPENGFGYNLMKKMKSFGNAVAQIDALTGKTETFSELLLKCVRTAIEMKSRGLKKGDIIGICSYNHMNVVVPFVAAHLIGAVVSATDPIISLTDTKFLIEVIKPKIFFVSCGSEELIASAINELGLNCSVVSFGNSKDYESFDNFIGEKENEENFKPIVVGNLEPALIMFSSGTSGLPKATVLGHGNILLQSLNMGRIRKEAIKSLMFYSSPYWASFSIAVGFSCLNGLERVICHSFNPETHWSIVHKYKVEFIFLAPTHAISSIKYAEHDLVKHVKIFLIGGTSITTDYLIQIENIFKNKDVVHYSYGMTEIGVVLQTYTRDVKWKTKLNCCGMPAPGSKLKIVDPETQEVLGCNQPGELRAKPIYPMLEYLNQDCRNDYDADGFFKSGDLLYYDEDYCFFYSDRLKDVFKYKSLHIHPAKIEIILESHPDVLLSSVVGVKHPTDDNHIMAFVELNKNDKSTAQDLQNFVDNQVDDRYKLRGGVVIIDSMPLTPSGKIKKAELKRMAEKYKKCSGVNYCSFILTEDCPGATRWGPGNFSVTYACIAERRMTKYCNYNITLPSPEVIGISEGFIRNPGYPLYYLGLQECRWIIQAPPMQRIKIIILDLSLISTNRDPEDCQDLFEIKESGTTRFVSCLQVEPPKVVISLSRTVEIYLRASETIVPRRGLLFYYSALGCPTPDSPKDGYLVFRNDTYALFSCCVGYAFADTMLRTKELICLGHNWNYKLPVANCIEKNKLDSYSQEVIKAQAKMTESLTDVVLPSIIIIALFIVNSIVLFFIYRYKKRKNALYIREEEEMKTMRSPENS